MKRQPPSPGDSAAADTPADPTATRRGRSADAVHRYILDHINEGALKPGDRVRESLIAERTGVSRTPVREAMQRLETEGLLSHTAHHGMAVRTLDHQEVTELYLIRGVLEGTAAGLAARHASEAEIDTLRDMLAVQSRTDASPVEHARWNKLFHQALYRGAHNRYLIGMLDSLATSMMLLGRTTLSLAERPASAHREHAAIVDAIARHEPEAAESEARAHIHAAHKARLRVMFEDDAGGGRGPRPTV